MKINKVSPDSNDYLKVLANIDDKPQALYYLGEIPKSTPADHRYRRYPQANQLRYRGNASVCQRPG